MVLPARPALLVVTARDVGADVEPAAGPEAHDHVVQQAVFLHSHTHTQHTHTHIATAHCHSTLPHTKREGGGDRGSVKKLVWIV